MIYRKTIEFKKFSIDFCNDWSQLVGKWNWIEFNPIRLYFEKSNMFGTFEIKFCLLGFCIRVYWIYNNKIYMEKVKSLSSRMEKCLE